MSKKKKPEKGKCKKCGHKLALAKAPVYTEFYFDQEPYEADVLEPVYIDKIASDCVGFNGVIFAHICPACSMPGDLWVE